MRIAVLLFFLAPLLLATSCDKEPDDVAYRAAGITWLTDSGYTFANDTVDLSDTLRIGAVVAEGSERLRTVFVQVSYDGDPWVQHDSIPFTQNPMVLDVQAIMGDAPRSEEWSILARERNGNSTRRSLTFTVQ
jgi:hypothetical protein